LTAQGAKLPLSRQATLGDFAKRLTKADTLDWSKSITTLYSSITLIGDASQPDTAQVRFSVGF
jgi:hypothetical protein